MASPAHCAYCFDVLAGHLTGRKPASLDEVVASWDAFVTATAAATQTTTTKPPVDKGVPALHRLADNSESSVASESSSALSTATSVVSTPGTSTSSLPTVVLDSEYPLFVTWNALIPLDDYEDEDEDEDEDGNDNECHLRGCIGTFAPHPLGAGLAEFALTAALEDSRFPSISAQELPGLQCAVTLLTDFEDAADVMDWTVGKHGLRISFTHHGRRYGATYLPDVAAEQGWSKEETLVSLMRKAGWMGSRSKWRDIDVKVVRYQGKKASLAYGQYQKWVAWRGQ